MKRVLKSMLSLAIISMLMLSLVACGKKEEDEVQTETEKFVSKYTTATEYEITLVKNTEGVEEQVTFAQKNDKKYIRTFSESSGEQVIIVDDQDAYLLDNTTKQYLVIPVEQVGLPEGNLLAGSIGDIDSLKDEVYTTGKETINEIEYNYEKLEKSNSKYYFDAEGNLKYILGNQGLMKIEGLTTDVEDSLFEIPSDYTEIDLSSLVSEE